MGDEGHGEGGGVPGHETKGGDEGHGEGGEVPREGVEDPVPGAIYFCLG